MTDHNKLTTTCQFHYDYVLVPSSRSNLFYNTSERHEWHECDTSNADDTSAIQVQHVCYTNDTSATRVKNFDFYNKTGENVFSHSYICYMVNERLQGEEQYHSKNYLLEMPRSHAKMRLKRARTTKTELCNRKSYMKKL